MQLYRVAWVDSERWRRTSQNTIGHPLYVPLDRQGVGRFDNPDHYAVLYTATEPAAAVGETLGNLHTWTPTLFTRPKDQFVRALITLEARPHLIDLDDASTLQRLALRPSDVVRRNQGKTREVALQLWLEDHEHVDGLEWWSYYRPEGQLVMLWSRRLKDPELFSSVEVVQVESLEVGHPVVELAATVLPRRVET